MSSSSKVTQERPERGSNFEVSLLRLPPGPFTLWTLHLVLNFQRRSIVDLEVFPDTTSWELKCLLTRELVHRSKENAKESELRTISALAAVPLSVSSSSAEWMRSELFRKQLVSPTPTPHEVTLRMKGQSLDGGSLASYGIVHLSTIEVDLRMGSMAAFSTSSQSSASSASAPKRQVIIPAGLPLSTRIAAAEAGVVDSRPITPPNTAFYPTLTHMQELGELHSTMILNDSKSTEDPEPVGEVPHSAESVIEREMKQFPQRRFLSRQLVLTLKALASAPYGVEDSQLSYFWKRIERGGESLGAAVDPDSGLNALQLAIVHARNPNLALLLLQQRESLSIQLSGCRCRKQRSPPTRDSAAPQTITKEQLAEDLDCPVDDETLPLLLLARRCLLTIPSAVRATFGIEIHEDEEEEEEASTAVMQKQDQKEKDPSVRFSMDQLEVWLLFVKVLPALVLPPPSSPASFILNGLENSTSTPAGLEWMPPMSLRKKVQHWIGVCHQVLLDHPDLFRHSGFGTERDRQRVKEAMNKISQLSLLPAPCSPS